MQLHHEFAHRDLFIADWGGFSDNDIGTPLNWRPGSGTVGVDSDADKVSDGYEDDHQIDFHFSFAAPCGILQWWLDNTLASDGFLMDQEMYAQLFGEWQTNLIGTLETSDWSAGGRLDF